MLAPLNDCHGQLENPPAGEYTTKTKETYTAQSRGSQTALSHNLSCPLTTGIQLLQGYLEELLSDRLK